MKIGAAKIEKVSVAVEPRQNHRAILFPERSRETSEYANEAARMASHPRDGLFSILMLVKPSMWMAGLWSDVPRVGWKDHRSGLTLTFEAASRLIVLRCEEMGIDEALVRAWPDTRMGMAEDQHFMQLPFEEQMETFRAVKGN